MVQLSDFLFLQAFQNMNKIFIKIFYYINIWTKQTDL